MKVRELIEYLENFDEESEVRLAMQPSWPFEYSIGEVEEVELEDEGETVVYISEDRQLRYLPGEVKERLMW
jgi:hypothetical protein